MKMYDDDERYTDEGMALAQEIALAVRPIMERYQKRGAKVREVSQIAQSECSLVELTSLIS